MTSRICQGLVVFDWAINEVVTVYTPAGHGGFTKGKSKPGESRAQTALRETKEEAGIDPANLFVLPTHALIELNDKANPSVGYTPAVYTGAWPRVVKCKDPEELDRVGWENVEQVKASPHFYEGRKAILAEAFRLLKADDARLVPAIVWLSQPDTEVKVQFFERVPSDGKQDRKLSGLLSKILRHSPDEYGVTMAHDGSVEVSKLLASQRFQQAAGKQKVTLADLGRVVRTNDKQRFSFTEYGKRIRANQGHSVEIDEAALLEELYEPLPVVLHGTTYKALPLIEAEGLKIMGRQHIHCATGRPGEVMSGMRRDCKVIIHIDMAAALADDIKFYRSANGVILTAGVNGVLAPQYFSRIERL